MLNFSTNKTVNINDPAIDQLILDRIEVLKGIKTYNDLGLEFPELRAEYLAGRHILDDYNNIGEEMLNEFDIVKASYDDYRNQAVEKIKDMIANKSVAYCIVYFRKWKWEDISKLFNYSVKQCQRLYKKEKMS